MRSKGFTLIEIMLAVGILGIVIGVVYGVFARTLEGKQHTEARAAGTATARAIVNRIVRDLQAIVPRGSSPLPQTTPTPSAGLPKAVEQILFVSRNRGDVDVPLDELAFTALTRRPSGTLVSPADLAVIRYFVVADPDAPQRRVLLRETTYSLSGRIFDLDEPDPASTVRLADGIAALEFRFFDGEEWIQEWDSSDTQNYGPAPQAVEIAVALHDELGDVSVFRTAVDLPIVRGAPLPVPGQAATPGQPTPPPAGPESGV